jgi:arylsulfatase A-like enzyme
MFRRSSCFVCLAILVASLSTVARVASAVELPNILVILTDDQGRGDYSAFGTKDIRTPHIDRVFREGMELTNFYANCCVCSPTRAALLTGCYPDRVGVPGVIRHTPENSWGYLSPKVQLLPQVLKTRGYHTAAIGKWHLGLTSPNTPTERGFDFFHGFLGDMMDDYWHHRRGGHNFMRKNLEVIEPKGHATDLFSDWACDYLAERANSTDGQPFFLYLAYNAPHDPIQPPPEWVQKVKAREPEMTDRRAKLVALIEHLDDGIGRVLNRLDELNLAQDTLVIFTSDNGGVRGYEANNGPWRGDKQHMYEGGIRVPAAARWPGKIKPGAKEDRNLITMDIFATACAAAGAEVPKNIDGVSFLGELLGKAIEHPPRDLYFVRREGGPNYGGLESHALRRGDWKLIHDGAFLPLELYNLADDPYEKNNLAERNKQKVNELRAAMSRQVQQAGRVPWQPPVDPVID